jgi:hypothetical protein
MNHLTDDEEKRAKMREYKREYIRKYRLSNPEYDLKQRKKPEYRHRELLRMKRCYDRVRIFKIMPQYV